ncbi:AAA family ATPase [Lacipirellula sp.]|uniref:AAA family ATPase n=1 Tax=Lacipirellula sp. TaxID=2691419 RepID=UPI003D14E03B
MDGSITSTPPAAAAWRPDVVTVSELEAKPIEWLWEGYIPLGALTILEGDPGLGKSQITCDLAARVTHGLPMPHSTAVVEVNNGVLMMNCEDDPRRVMYQRLEAAGADLTRVQILREMTTGADERPIAFPDDIVALREVLALHGIGLAVIDPLVGFVGDDVNVNGDAEVRRLLSQLAKLAEELNVAIVLVRHLNKRAGISAKYRGGGSIGLTGAARSVLTVARDPDDPQGCVMASVKSNLGPPPQSVKFTIEPVDLTSRVAWGDLCDFSADTLLEGTAPATDTKLNLAIQILLAELAEGPRPEVEIATQMERRGISPSTVKRARKQLGVKAAKRGFDDGWDLCLPDIPGAYSAQGFPDEVNDPDEGF